MPPAKSRPAQEDSRSDASTTRERAVAAAAHARRAKNGTSAPQQNGVGRKDSAPVSKESRTAVASGPNTGVRL